MRNSKRESCNESSRPFDGNAHANELKAKTKSRKGIKFARRTAALMLMAATAFCSIQSNGDDNGKSKVPLVKEISSGVATDVGNEVLANVTAVDVKAIANDKAGPTDKTTATDKSEKTTGAAKPKAKESAEEPILDRSVLIPAAGKSVSPSDVSVSKDSGTVEIHVNDANLVEVLRMLSMQSNTNILPSKEVRGAVTANLYDVTVKEALDAILVANGFGYREKGNVIYVMSAKEIADTEKANRKQITKVFHLYYTPAANAQTMIKPVLSTEGQVAVTTPAATGIDVSGKDSGGNTHAVEDMMVVTDYQENLDKIEKILKEVDKRPQQILVEATILRASLNEDNSMGIDFTLLGGVNFSALGSNPVAAGAQALAGTLTNGGKPVTGYTAGGTGFTSGLPAGGLRVGLVYDNVSAFIQALEGVTDTTVMANPKILMVNKQKGEVKVARMDPFRGKTTTTETGLTQQDIEFLETGTVLVIRPYIGDDGYVRMEVHPEDSTPLASQGAGLPPTKLTTETTTNIMVKDGRTVVIGGLFRETNQTSRNQVPGIGNIPLFGNLFKNQHDTTVREEVIILLTPHIIKDEEAYSKASEAEMKDAEKLRVGTRRGMMPWGRERLAESSFEQATAEMNKPNPDRQKAVWHLNCATNLNPKFIEAINLKQKISGTEVTSVDNSAIRSFVRARILADANTTIPIPAQPTMPRANADIDIVKPTEKSKEATTVVPTDELPDYIPDDLPKEDSTGPTPNAVPGAKDDLSTSSALSSAKKKNIQAGVPLNSKPASKTLDANPPENRAVKPARQFDDALKASAKIAPELPVTVKQNRIESSPEIDALLEEGFKELSKPSEN